MSTRRLALAVTPVGVGGLGHPHQHPAGEQQVGQQGEVEHLPPAGIERRVAHHRSPVAERRAEDELPLHQVGEPVVARHHEIVVLPAGDQPLGEIGHRQLRLAPRADHGGVGEDGGGVRVALVPGDHGVHVAGQELVVGVEQRHEVGVGEGEAPVPVARQPEVRRVALVDEPGS